MGKIKYPIIDGMKLCGRCKIMTPISDCGVQKHPDGRITYKNCRTCIREDAIAKRRLKGINPRKFYPVIDGKRECTKCHEVKPIDKFTPSNKKKLGILGHCKECDLKASLEWRRSKGMRPTNRIIHPIINGMKQCNRCNEHLPVDSFGISSKGYIIQTCKKCVLKKLKPLRLKYYKRDSEEITDGYLGMVLRKHINVKLKDIPQELLDMTRNKIKLQREIKKLKQSQ